MFWFILVLLALLAAFGLGLLDKPAAKLQEFVGSSTAHEQNSDVADQ